MVVTWGSSMHQNGMFRGEVACLGGRKQTGVVQQDVVPPVYRLSARRVALDMRQIKSPYRPSSTHLARSRLTELGVVYRVGL